MGLFQMMEIFVISVSQQAPLAQRIEFQSSKLNAVGSSPTRCLWDNLHRTITRINQFKNMAPQAMLKMLLTIGLEPIT